jgi:hypothetical protein
LLEQFIEPALKSDAAREDHVCLKPPRVREIRFGNNDVERANQFGDLDAARKAIEEARSQIQIYKPTSASQRERETLEVLRHQAPVLGVRWFCDRDLTRYGYADSGYYRGSYRKYYVN